MLSNRVITTGKTAIPTKPSKNRKVQNSSTGFDSVLKNAVNNVQGVKFSKHAEARLKSRNIQIDTSQMNRINEAVSKAEQKGVKESLVLMDSIAMVVSVKNRTVITAVNNEELKENVFTNIDGAVII